jgi:hypothetical protein
VTEPRRFLVDGRALTLGLSIYFSRHSSFALLLTTHYSLLTAPHYFVLGDGDWRRGQTGCFPSHRKWKKLRDMASFFAPRVTEHGTRSRPISNPPHPPPSFRGPPSTRHSLFTTHCPSPLFLAFPRLASNQLAPTQPLIILQLPPSSFEWQLSNAKSY